MMDQMTIEKVLDAANIVDVVSQFVTLRRRGVNYVGLCPFHNEKTPSFYVSPSKGICKCFSCGKGGNAIHFIMEHEQMSFPQAVEWLAVKYGIPFSKREPTPEEKLRQDERESLFIVNDFACKWFQNILNNTPSGQSIGKTYFHSRGFRDDIIEKFQLGYCPDNSDDFAKAALTKGFRKEYLIATGLCYEREEENKLRDRFRGRAIFPVHSVSGKIVAFGGRIMKSDVKVAKYVNSPESVIYKKSNELYGLFFARQAIVKRNRCFLVEGYADVISMFQAGVENVVASSGTSLTSSQIRLIHRFTSNITVLYDGDMAGIKASLRGIDMLLEEGMNVKVLLLPDGEDPDSFARGRSAADFQKYIDSNQVDFIRFKVRLIMDEAEGDPIRRASLIKEITSSISVIPDQIVRAVYIRECSQLMQVDERMLITEVNKLHSESRRNSEEKTRKEPATLMEHIPGLQIADEKEESDPIEELRISIRKLLVSEKATVVDKEKMLARLIVRYGDKICCYTTYEGNDNYAMKVGEYIIGAMKADSLSFFHPVYKTIASLYSKHFKDDGFVSERYFLSNPDSVVSLTAANLIEERYQLSGIYKEMGTQPEEDNLFGITDHILSDYRLAVVNYEIRQLEKKMQSPDVDDIISLQKEYKVLLSARNILAKRLGDRIVT